MTLKEIERKVEALDDLASSYYDKFEAVDNAVSELRDVLDDWECDEEINNPDVGDFAPNQIEDYHFECLTYNQAQERIAEYPDICQKILARVKQ